LTRDDGSGSGFDGTGTTYYSIDKSPPSIEGTSIAINSSGIYTIKYYSVDDVGNEEIEKTATNQAKLDKEAPTTDILLLGDKDENGWYVLSVQVTLSAVDGVSGVASTIFKIDSDSWQDYSSPFTIDSNGVHKIEFYSIDNAGNREDTEGTNSETVRIVEPDIAVSSTQWDYSNPDLANSKYSDREFVVSNPGNGRLDVTADLTGDREFSIQNGSFSLNPGEKRAIVVRFSALEFKPKMKSKHATLTLFHNVPDKEPVEVQVSVLRGDVNGNVTVGEYDKLMADYSELSMLMKGIEKYTRIQRLIGDVSKNNQLDAHDGGMIARYMFAEWTRENLCSIEPRWPDCENGVAGSLGIAERITAAEASILSIMGQAGGGVEVSIPSITGHAGADIAVPIDTSDTTGLGILAVGILLTYNPGVLAVPEDIEHAVTLGTIASRWHVHAYTTNGQIVIITHAQQEIASEALSGAGTLVKVNFHVSDTADVDDYSPLTLARVSLNEGDVPAYTYHGGFIVDGELQLLHLEPGWNLTSIRFDTEDSSVLSVLDPIRDCCRSVWTYDANLGNWERYVFDEPNSPNGLQFIVPGKGYWIYMDARATLAITGVQTQTDIPLYTGWNLVGYNYQEGRDLDTDSMPESCTSIWTYDSREETWLKCVKGVPDNLNDLNRLEPGKGYWIYAPPK
jgi:hypothetical protein